jgi:maltose alpha-D-glucosyltransferase/alpha-amylase
MDASGDGVGDFEGLSRRLDYLSGLGVTCIWLQPYYPSPNQDNGYDVSDYYGVHERHGNLGDFVEFMNHARSLGMRVIVDLVVNHTSTQHPWFQAARSDARSPFRDYYVWSRERPADHATGIVFPGVQETTWTWDDAAEAYYFHRFYDWQPDLDTSNPKVRQEIKKVMGFWLELGVSGFRMDAVPFLIEKKGAGVEHTQDFELLHEMRDFLQWRAHDAILLAEANVPADQSIDYFGDQGDRLQLMLNFPVNQRLFYALASADLEPLKEAIAQTRSRPPNAQWVNFLRSHDELDLGRLSDAQRQRVFSAFAPDPGMQLYERGVRRRLAPMLGGDRARLGVAFSLLFSLPGTPMMQYGDEIGIGDDLTLAERECARTPMQWTSEPHGGFTTGAQPVRPVIHEGPHGFRSRNLADQRRDPHSLLNWTERMIRTRKECRELSWGDVTILPTDVPSVLALEYAWRGTALLTLHNFSAEAQTVTFDVQNPTGQRLLDILGRENSNARSERTHRVTLAPYDYRWFRVGAVDNALRWQALVARPTAESQSSCRAVGQIGEAHRPACGARA